MLPPFRAAILERSRSPLVVDMVTPPDELAAGQVLVQVHYSGICGAQLNEIEAAKGPDRFLPHLLGHEGVGEVVAVGPLVKTVNIGDQVVLHWMPGAGIQSDPATYTWQGQRLNAGWVTTFSEFTIVSENRCTPVETPLDPIQLPLFGCAATTAMGVVGNDARLRMGDSVVVLGTGGVGLLTIEAARISGGYPIIGVDRVAARLDHARNMGAAVTVDTSVDGDVLQEIIESLDGRTPDIVIETTGAKSMIELGYRLVAGGGTCVLVGVPRHDEPATLDTLPIHFDTVLTGSKGGSCNPGIDIPKLVRLAEAGRFNLAALPVTRLPLEAINEGLDLIQEGLPGRIVIDMTSS